MSRVLVLGATGMLGHKMLQVLAADGHEFVGTVRGDLGDLGRVGEFLTGHARIVDSVDATSFDLVEEAIHDMDPEVVVNCVGIVKQRTAATDPMPSITVNALFPHLLAQLCAREERRLIHFSTDCVFSGDWGPYTEEDESDARDLYGRTKYLGEVADPALTLRTSIIGRELANFESLVEWLISEDGGTVRGFRRAMYSGVTTLQAARTVAQVIADFPRLAGLYQFAGPVISKHDLLVEIREAMELDITIIPDDELAIDRTLSGERFIAATGLQAPSWVDMIADMVGDPTPYEEMR